MLVLLTYLCSVNFFSVFFLYICFMSVLCIIPLCLSLLKNLEIMLKKRLPHTVVNQNIISEALRVKVGTH